MHEYKVTELYNTRVNDAMTTADVCVNAEQIC